VLIVSLCAAAIIGDQVNYGLGRKTGEVVYSWPDGRIVKRRHFEQARTFYEERGASAIVIGRFMPILRTFVPFIGGVAQMQYLRFVIYNVFGGVLWVTSLVLLGYFIGMTPLASKLHRVMVIVVAMSLTPLAWGAFKQWRASRSPRNDAQGTGS
jgi:membrane-associated protein